LELIVLFIIISIIGSAIKSASQSSPSPKPVQKKQPGQSSISGNKMQRTTGKSQNFGSYPKKTLNNRPKLNIIKDETVHSSPYENLPDYIYTEEKTATYIDVAPKLEIEHIESVSSHKLDFSQDNLINAIIISEILGPPLSRRR